MIRCSCNLLVKSMTNHLKGRLHYIMLNGGDDEIYKRLISTFCAIRIKNNNRNKAGCLNNYQAFTIEIDALIKEYLYIVDKYLFNSPRYLHYRHLMDNYDQSETSKNCDSSNTLTTG